MPKIKKILLLSSRFPEQDSVQTISDNLCQNYLALRQYSVQVHFCDLDDLRRIDFSCLDCMIIVHPWVIASADLRQALLRSGPDSKIIFHLFGDFVRKSNFYIAYHELLLGRNVQFLSAGDSYCQLIKKSLQDHTSAIVPFPIQVSKFAFSSRKRSAFRSLYNISADEKVVLYCGRVSPQKNVRLLLEAFWRLKQSEKNKKLKLIIVGNLDDLERPTFYEKNYLPGEYFHELSTYIKKKNITDVLFLPRTGHDQLTSAYSGADLFVSLSLYHDEDYGYAPREALLAGCPVVLSAWGGYRDVKSSFGGGKWVGLLSVKYAAGSLSISRKALIAQLEKSLAMCQKLDRKKFSAEMRAKHGAQSFKNDVWPVLKKERQNFSGFSEQYITLSLQMLIGSKVNAALYRYFYSSFWRDEK